MTEYFNLRMIIFHHGKDGEPCARTNVKGYFHRWGLACNEKGNSYTIAIVEDLHGHIYAIPPEMFVFLQPESWREEGNAKQIFKDVLKAKEKTW